MAARDEVAVAVRLMDRPQPVMVDARGGRCCEEIAVMLARDHVGIRPLASALVGLWSSADGLWLAPDQELQEWLATSAGAAAAAASSSKRPAKTPLEFRIRFKVPYPDKLLKRDKNAFDYFYHQTRTDFYERQGEVIRAKIAVAKLNKENWKWKPIINTSDEAEREVKRDLMHKMHNLVLLNLAVAAHDEALSEKEIQKSVDKFVPKNMWQNIGERMISMSPLFSDAAAAAQKLKRAHKSEILKLEYLCKMEEFFPDYYCARFGEALWNRPDGQTERVRLFVKPPMKGKGPASDSSPSPQESEPELQMYTIVKHENADAAALLVPTTLPVMTCAVEEICNVSYGEGSGAASSSVSVEISRRSGIPLYLKLPSRSHFASLVSHLSGYYRLCEKWTFSLCNQIYYPSLHFNMSNNVHGPVSEEFVEEKFAQKCKHNKSGYYILRQSPDRYDLLYLHYLPADTASLSSKLGVLHIVKAEDGKYRVDVPQMGTTVTKQFSTLSALIRSLRQAELIQDCLHPSEYDRSDSLLLCRSETKLKADLVGGDAASSACDSQKVIIPFNALSRFETERFEGRFTNVWKGCWRKPGLAWKSNVQTEVAIKQLKQAFHDSKLREFIYLAESVLRWDEGTLVKVYGTTLAARDSPMALITEYFPLGSLDLYLMEHRERVREVDQVEACTALSRAVWYLEEIGMSHGNVRCSNVFVVEHTDANFKVKLGDCTLSSHYGADQVHWLPLELLVEERPTPAQCTSKGDVWAAATTFWQIFSGGETPLQGRDAEEARTWYVEGKRLRQPAALESAALGPIYRVMLECWAPGPDQRKEPQALMRDMNQLMYRVFNSRKVHSYITINENDDEDDASTLDGSVEPPGTVETVLASGATAWSAASPGSASQYVQAVARNGALVNGGGSSSEPTSLSPGINGRASSLSPVRFSRGAQSPYSDSSSAAAPAAHLVPAYDDFMKKIFAAASASAAADFSLGSSVAGDLFPGRVGGLLAGRRAGAASSPSAAAVFGTDGSFGVGRYNSSDRLLNGGSVSRPGSSLQGSLFQNDMISQFTSQTSLASQSASLYSVSSIYQLDETQLSLNQDRPLGEGNFGVVYRGAITHSNGDWDLVAVKMLRDPEAGMADAAAEEEMRKELNIMKKLNHDNIVKIRAVIRDEIEMKVLIVMEFVPHGSLQTYLKVEPRSNLDFPRQLFIYAQNIVEGMEYLGSKGIIHRDLAARNILVASEEQVKISDFGLARSVDKDHYVMSSVRDIPIKWLALECLTSGCYSFASDVWSFGVTLWEMFSFGADPHIDGCEGFFSTAGATNSQNAHEVQTWVTRLGEGARPPKPAECPDALYKDVLLPCWSVEPARRPSFSQLQPLLARVERQVT